MKTDYMTQFRNAMLSSGINPPDIIEPNGKIHRFSTNKKRKDNAGWYVLFIDGISTGAFGDWRTGVKHKWHANIGGKLTKDEKDKYKKKIKLLRLQQIDEENKRYIEAREQANKIWRNATKFPNNHNYLKKKEINAYGLREHQGKLIIPVTQDGLLHSLQFIDAYGNKNFLIGGRIKECYYSIGDSKKVICICEGYATGASIHQATKYGVAVAFNASNLVPVAKFLRAKFPNTKLIICADDDAWTIGNPGLTRAHEAALISGGLLAIPDFGEKRIEGMTDFNDLATYQGIEAIRKAIKAAKVPENHSYDQRNSSSSNNDWPELQPLIDSIDSYPYPISALPEDIAGAIQEVADFVQCPLPIAACSGLATLSLAVQGLANVRRAGKLIGPISLYILAIAQSGERKTTCDKLFIAPIRDWERKKNEEMRIKKVKHEAEIKIWKAMCEGITQEIKKQVKNDSPIDLERLKEELKKLESNKPASLRIPRLVYGDTTPEALAWSLVSTWPSGGIMSSEAGIIFGSHGMGKDSIMRNLAQLNLLWDGDPLIIDRRGSESFILQGARLTIGLAVQPETVRSFLASFKGLARDIGFISRFLITWPQSTQGTRFYKEDNEEKPFLRRFCQNIENLLNEKMLMNNQFEINPDTLILSPEAQAVWVEFYNKVEEELTPSGDLAETKDIASKAADNAARLAAMLYIYENGVPKGNALINEKYMISAVQIITWHLYEAKRFLRGLVLSSETLSMLNLSNWLLDYCKKNNVTTISIRDIQRLGPNSLRNRISLNKAINALISAGRVRYITVGTKNSIEINPKLLEFNNALT